MVLSIFVFATNTWPESMYIVAFPVDKDKFEERKVAVFVQIHL